MTNKYSAVLAIIFIAFFGIACDSVTTTEAPKVITLIADESGFGDMSFNYSGKLGIEKLQEDYDISVVLKTVGIDGTASQLIAKSASYSDLTICLGYTFANDLDSIAAYYPARLFSIIDFQFPYKRGNINSSRFDVKQATYPIGYLAAGVLHNTNQNYKIGFIGGEDTEEINQFLTGFARGINRYDSLNYRKTELLVNYVDSYSDSAKCYQMAKEMIAQGVKILFPPAGKSGLGAFAAAKESGAYAIGYDVDCAEVLPNFKDIILTSCIKRIDNAVYSVAEYYLKNGIIQPVPYFGNFKNQGVAIAPINSTIELISDSLKLQINEIVNGIINRSIVI